jgi:tRNA 2-thiouridine synthesizing protein A
MGERHTLDARRLLCPMPVIRVQEKVDILAPGDVLEVWCTDPGTRSDIPAWCRINGHRMLDIIEADGELVLTLEVGEDSAPGIADE